MLTFGITRLAAGGQPFVEISQEDFDLIKTAKQKLIIVLGIEEKLDILLEDYAEFERELLNLTLDRMLFLDLDHLAFLTDIHLIDRRLANFLAASRLYVDQVTHDISVVYGAKSRQHDAVVGSFNQEYDASLEYRTIVAIRNYVQHRSLPIQILAYPRNVDPKRIVVRCTIEPRLDLSDLAEDSKFKPSVLRELQAKGDSHPNVTPFVRRYIEAIGRTHEEVRRILAPDVEIWDGALSSVVKRAREAFESGDELAGLGIVSRDVTEKIHEPVHVSENLIKRRKSLERKNRALGTLSKRYVSGECSERPPWDQPEP